MKDLSGQRFGRLLVTNYDKEKSSKSFSYWLCQCDCGLGLSIRRDCLLKRGQTSCGCEHLNFKIGDKIGLLTIIKNLGVLEQRVNGKSRGCWECRCDCGNMKICFTQSLSVRCIKSCGCLIHIFDRKKNKFDTTLVKYWFFRRFEQGAISRNLDFTITQEYISNLFINQNAKCVLSGIDITLPKSSRECGTASLDRIDNTKGYIEGNVQWVHKDINKMKNTHTQDKFIEWCKLVANKC